MNRRSAAIAVAIAGVFFFALANCGELPDSEEGLPEAEGTALTGSGSPYTLKTCDQASILSITPAANQWIFNKAFVWVNNPAPNGVPYGQYVCGSGGPQGGPYPYRCDCSGYVSYSWCIPPSGDTTSTITPRDATKVSWTELEPGDALLYAADHVMLFGGWLTPTTLCTVEEPHTGLFASLKTRYLNGRWLPKPSTKTIADLFYPIRLNPKTTHTVADCPLKDGGVDAGPDAGTDAGPGDAGASNDGGAPDGGACLQNGSESVAGDGADCCTGPEQWNADTDICGQCVQPGQPSQCGCGSDCCSGHWPLSGGPNC